MVNGLRVWRIVSLISMNQDKHRLALVGPTEVQLFFFCFFFCCCFFLLASAFQLFLTAVDEMMSKEPFTSAEPRARVVAT